MSDWTVCGSCQLKHQARPDGICPRCKSPIGATSAYATPTTESAPEPAPLPTGTVSVGAKIAGVLMILSGVLVLMETVRGGGSVSPVSTIIDFVIGGSLLANKDKFLVWAQVRVGLGLLVFGGMSLAQGDFAGVAVQVLFSTSLLMLLLGRPGKARTVVGTAMAGVVVALMLFGSLVEATGSNPLMGLAYEGESDPIPSGVVQGQLRPYTLTLPDQEWRLRQEAPSRRDNPLADRWVVKPSADAHVVVIVEALEDDQTLDFAAFQTAVTENLKSATPDLRVVDERPSPNGLILHTRGRTEGLPVHHLVRLYSDRGVAVQVLAFAGDGVFEAEEANLRAILESFKM